MSRAAGNKRPKEEDLIAARDAALECVAAAKNYWDSIVALPPIDPAMAAHVSPDDITAVSKRIGPYYVRLGAAIAAFDRIPAAVLDALDKTAMRDGHFDERACAYRDARALAAELHEADRHIQLDPARQAVWGRVRELTRWQRVREIVPPGSQATPRWNTLTSRINRTHRLMLAPRAPVTSKQRRREIPKSIEMQGKASQLCKLLQREECDSAGRSLDDMLHEARVSKDTFRNSTHFREARCDWQRVKAARESARCRRRPAEPDEESY